MKDRGVKSFRIKRKGNSEKQENNQSGFSIVEVVVALVVLLIVLLGVFMTFAYAVNYNAGNHSRAQAIAVLQQEVETLRSKKFTPGVTDTELTGGTKAAKTVTLANGYRYRINVTIDDDPTTTVIDTDATKTIKEISVTVALDNPTPGWQSAVPVTVLFRRTRAN